MAYQLDHVKVLIVDDMQPMLDLTRSVLETFGFTQIFTAENGEKAFEIAKEHDPDFIITDWLMDGMDGLELTKKIRTDKDSPNQFVPIIMMTGFSSKLRVENARDIGITEFLVKPFNAKDLYARVFQIIEKPRQFVSTEEFFGPDRRRKRIKDYKGPRRRSADPFADNVGQSETDSVANEILAKLKEDVKNI